jgi:N4-(beta-N-acetylglucosaminyl)-L-asparaginase
VERLRQGVHPNDAGMEALRRIKSATREKRLLNGDGNPNFNLRFYILNRKGEYAGVSLYAQTRLGWESGRAGTTAANFAVCTEGGPQTLPCEALLGVQAEG